MNVIPPPSDGMFDDMMRGIPPTDGVARAEADARTVIRSRSPELRVPAPYLAPEAIENQERTFEGINYRQLGVFLRQDISAGRVNYSDFQQNWTEQPWRAYPFLARVLYPSPMLQDLKAWHDFVTVQMANLDPTHTSRLWETQNPLQAQQIKTRMRVLHESLTLFLRTEAVTIAQLREQRAAAPSNTLERVAGDFWQYAWRDMSEHPVTSGALLVGGFMLAHSLFFGRLKNTRLGTVTRWGIGLTVVLTFLRDRYGFQLTEDGIARPLERWGAPTAAAWFRRFRDTLTLPFRRTDQDGSAFSYLSDKLRVQGDDEKTMFSGIMTMSPQNFVAAYDAARRIELGSAGSPTTLPPEVRAVLNQMRANQALSAIVASNTDAENLRLFLRVAGKVLDAMPTGGNRDAALAFLRDRMVTGDYFTQVTARARAGASSGGIAAADGRASVVTYGVPRLGVAARSANAGGSVTMLDAMLVFAMTDEDWNRIRGYSPEAAAAAQLRDDLVEAGREAVDTTVGAARRAVRFITDDIPSFWNNTVWPAIRPTAEAAQAQLRRALDAATSAGSAAITFARDSALGRVFMTVFGVTADQARSGFSMTAEEARKFATWLEYMRVKDAIGNADFDAWRGQFQIDYDANAGANEIDFSGDMQVWRALHDKGVIRVANRDAINDPTTGATRARLTRAEADKLNRWLQIVDQFRSRPGSTPSDTTGLRTRDDDSDRRTRDDDSDRRTRDEGPGRRTRDEDSDRRTRDDGSGRDTRDEGPGRRTRDEDSDRRTRDGEPLPPGRSTDDEPLPPSIESLSSRIRRIEEAEIAPGVRGLTVQSASGKLFIVYPNPSGENYPLEMSERDLRTLPIDQIVERWRGAAFGRLQTNTNLLGTTDPLYRGFSPWEMTRLGFDVEYRPRNSRMALARTPLHMLLRQTPQRIHDAYIFWRRRGPAEAAITDPFLLPDFAEEPLPPGRRTRDDEPLPPGRSTDDEPLPPGRRTRDDEPLPPGRSTDDEPLPPGRS